MKRIFFTLIALGLFYGNNLSADNSFSECYDNCPQDACCTPPCQDWSVEFRVAAFFPQNHKVRSIYSNAWADYQVQIGKRFWCNWQVFGEFSGFQKDGHSSFGDKTTLRVFPFTLGAKYFFNLCSNLEAYVGGGAVYSLLRIKDDSPYVHRHVSKGQFGGVIKTGLVYTFCNCWFADLFADYLFQRFSYHGVSCDPFVYRHTADLSGFKLGLGIGYQF